MNWDEYEEKYRNIAKINSLKAQTIDSNLLYARKLYENKVPIIFDEYHFSKLVGIDYSYMYKVLNDQRKFYRKFYILKSDGTHREINEPLPNLKIIQSWILKNILNNTEIHPSAKAYTIGVSIKENVKYHRNQKHVLKLDIVKFFNNINDKFVYMYFRKLGYTKKISVLLMKLCTINNSLPQGAPTSASLSNIILKGFDHKIYKYARKKGIRYTRYADDMTFSGEFNKNHIIQIVSNQLKKYNLSINEKKIRLLKQHQKQIVTGIVVNQKIQISRTKRRDLRQEVYFIKKYGLENHLSTKFPNRNFTLIDQLKYLKSLLGKIQFGLFINKNDKYLNDYKNYLLSLREEIIYLLNNRN